MDGDKAADEIRRKQPRLNDFLYVTADPQLCVNRQQSSNVRGHLMRRNLLHKLKQKRKYDPRRQEVRKQKSRMEKFVKCQQKAKWNSERKCRAAEIRESKEAKENRKEFFRIRKHLPPSPDVCPLYNCPRPHLRKRHKALQQQERQATRMTTRSSSSRQHRNQGSPASVMSTVSNQSVRSRSPIVFYEFD